MMDNVVKRALGKGERVIGTGLSLGSLRSAELLANTGFDFLMLDTQHGHFDKPTATTAIRTLVKSNRVPFARVSENSIGLINDYLDAGAMGVVVPMVNSAEEAARAVRGAYYPPLGARSKGSIASVVHGSDYPQLANERITLTIMIETPKAVERIAEIVAVEGLGCCLIGTSDLSFVLGVEPDSEEFARYVQTVVKAARQRDVAVGISVKTPGEVERWAREGIQLFLASHDLALLESAIYEHDRAFDRVRATTSAQHNAAPRSGRFQP